MREDYSILANGVEYLDLSQQIMKPFKFVIEH